VLYFATVVALADAIFARVSLLVSRTDNRPPMSLAVSGGWLTPSQRHIDRVRAATADRREWVIDLTQRICQTPAPTGSEEARARFVARLLADAGYATEISDIYNVYARRGRRGGPALMLSAHTDTVFPASTPIDVTGDGDVLRGPGIGDNSLGVAASIGLFRVLDDLGIDTERDIILAATVGEEGLGNLRGVRAAVERFRPELGAVIAVEGHNLGRVTHAAVGSVRWRITVTGPGGHSWGAFGKPSAVHGLARIITAIDNLTVPSDPKTTFNVGMIDGGVSVNTIAPRASAVVDMRSIDSGALKTLVDRVGEIAANAAGHGLETNVEVLGERPAGANPRSNWLVSLAGTTLRQLGMQAVFDASSTDANVPISLGIPAICIGITHGGLGHTTSEYIETEPIDAGLSQLALLAIEATATLAGGQRA
jgi:acetylornithine deacetylase/succinyl-diaminopimelate desuccinylase-like protein